MSKSLDAFRVLTLDGGGGKGAYTLGVLKEIETAVGKPLREHFHLFYGTSTGSIIAAALAIGATVDEITDFYMEWLPKIMRTFLASRRSHHLSSGLKAYFKDKKFDSVSVPLGIVGTNTQGNRPIVFKSFASQAHGMRSSFIPGFGLTLADAVEASCSAFPFFEPKVLKPTNNLPEMRVIDGGFVANNPSLFALVDVRGPLGISDDQIRILSVGTGTYPEKYPVFSYVQGARLIATKKMIGMQFAANANSVEIVFRLMTANLKTVRVSDTFSEPKLGTSLFEYRSELLNKLRAEGRWSFGQKEKEILEVILK